MCDQPAADKDGHECKYLAALREIDAMPFGDRKKFPARSVGVLHTRFIVDGDYVHVAVGKVFNRTLCDSHCDDHTCQYRTALQEIAAIDTSKLHIGVGVMDTTHYVLDGTAYLHKVACIVNLVLHGVDGPDAPSATSTLMAVEDCAGSRYLC